MMTHVVRVALLLLGTFVTFVVISVIALFLVMSIAIGCDRFCFYRQTAASRQIRNNNLKVLSKLRNIPYGSLVFQEAIDCSICYETFKNDQQIIQLQCHKFHIFHFDCLQTYLMHPEPEEKVCPLCRLTLVVQDPPILE